MPFVFPHRQTIAKMYAGLYPNSDPNMVTDLQLLQMRKQMIEASSFFWIDFPLVDWGFVKPPGVLSGLDCFRFHPSPVPTPGLV